MRAITSSTEPSTTHDERFLCNKIQIHCVRSRINHFPFARVAHSHIRTFLYARLFRQAGNFDLPTSELSFSSYVIRLCVFFFTLARKNTPDLLWCLQQFFMLLYYTNFSINFLLYAMCGITFRRCLQQLLRKILKTMTRYHCNLRRYV